MKTSIWISLALATFAGVHVAYGFLPPNTLPFTPGCTTNAGQVTPTLPLCPLPFEQWITVARSVPGNSPRPNGVLPPWFNKNLALRGQMVTSEYRFPWYIIMFFGLLIEINMPDIRNPLMFNKKNTNGPDNAKRDMATIMQGLIWTKNFFYKMPTSGSSYFNSIQSVRNTHIDVQTRGYAKMQTSGCIVQDSDWNTQPTDDVLWNAFAADIAASNISPANRVAGPPMWLQCPPTTDCSACSACANCVPVYNWANCTGSNQGCTILSTECVDEDDNTCAVASETCTCTNTYDLPYCLTSNEGCFVDHTDCTDCSACAAATCTQNAVPSCRYAQPLTYNCGTCTCDQNSTNCGGCGTCTNYDTCLNYTVPLYNQQGMVLVIYNLVAYPILFSSSLGFSATDPDLWAFNHIWATIAYGLGIDDQYNVFLQPNLAAAKNYYQKIYDQVILPGLFNFDQQTKLMMDNVFKGLSTATLGFMSPAFLLHRFVANFLNVPAPNLHALMTTQELIVDDTFSVTYIPAFANNPLFRALMNTAINDFSYFSANFLFPGNCTTYTVTATKCFV